MRRDAPARLARTVGATLAIALAGASGAHAAPGDISTVAGTGVFGYNGDGGLATSADINGPEGVAALPGGGFLFVDQQNHRIRKVDTAGIISTVAGNGTLGSGGDGGPATSAQLSNPYGLSLTADGGFLIGDQGNNRVRKVSAGGIITTVAGTGINGSFGDGGLAVNAQLNRPHGVAETPDGGFLIADYDNSKIRRVSPAGIITTVAGTGNFAFSGDGGPATSADLSTPIYVHPSADGGFLIADFLNNRIRKVSAGGTITTVAGNGGGGFSGDGGPATAAQLSVPRDAIETPGGDLLIADNGNNRIRRVSGATITTIAGNGSTTHSGDGGPALAAGIGNPNQLALTAAGALYVSERFGSYVRRIEPLPADYRDTVLADGPLAYYRLGNPSGSALTDSADSHNGTCKNGVKFGVPSLLASSTNTAARFDGKATYCYVNGIRAPTTAYTLEGWMKLSSLKAGTIVDHGGAGALYVKTDRFCFRQTQTNVCWNHAPVVGQIRHVVGTWSTADNTARLYVDGVLRASAVAKSRPSGSATFYIGYGQTAPWFAGVLDEVAYYPSALSAARVAAHHAAGVGP